MAAKVAKLEELHALAVETLKGEHRAALIAARAEAAGEAGVDASPTEKQLREKLSEAVGALEVSNKQCKSLKAKRPRNPREELEKVKLITTKAAEVLESRSADQRLMRSLKKELDLAVELEEAAERRAAYAEKEAEAQVPVASRGRRRGGCRAEGELADAVEVIAEFKASWEADRKVIALLSKMQAAPEDAQAAADATAAAAASEKKSEGLWDLAKKYGKKTLTFLGESAEKEREDVAAAKLRASAAKRNNAYGLEYNRAAGPPPSAKLRANENGDAPVVADRARAPAELARRRRGGDGGGDDVRGDETGARRRPRTREPAKKAPGRSLRLASNNAVPVRQAPATTAEKVAAAVDGGEAPALGGGGSTSPAPRDAAPRRPSRSAPTTPLDISQPAIGSPPAVASSERRRWLRPRPSLGRPAREPFTPSIVFPKSDGDDDTPKSSGWSSAHMPPGR